MPRTPVQLLLHPQRPLLPELYRRRVAANDITITEPSTRRMSVVFSLPCRKGAANGSADGCTREYQSSETVVISFLRDALLSNDEQNRDLYACSSLLAGSKSSCVNRDPLSWSSVICNCFASRFKFQPPSGPHNFYTLSRHFGHCRTAFLQAPVLLPLAYIGSPSTGRVPA